MQVGDHYQLPPLVQSKEAARRGLDQSLFRRLSEAHPSAAVPMSCQFRMCRPIMDLNNELTYGNQLLAGSLAVADARLTLPFWPPTAALLHLVRPDNSAVPRSRALCAEIDLQHQLHKNGLKIHAGHTVKVSYKHFRSQV